MSLEHEEIERIKGSRSNPPPPPATFYPFLSPVETSEIIVLAGKIEKHRAIPGIGHSRGGRG